MAETANTKTSLTLDDLFPNDRVLDVQITLTKENWDELRNQSQSFFDVLKESRKYEAPPSRYTYVPASVTIDGVEFPKIGLRKKGFIGSQDTRRPSLKVKLSFEDKEANIGGLSTLTLNNNKQDTSLTSQFVGYQLYDKIGLPCSRCSYARVTVNGKYLGIYSHVETVREPLARREFGTDKGTLYEGTVTDFHNGWEGSFENKFGDDEAGRKKIKLLSEVLESDDDTNIEKRIGEHVDLESFYKFWALESVIGFWDGYCGNRNNFFVYLNPETNKFHFMPWGADAMFEKYSQVERDPHSLPLSVKTKGYVAHRLYQSDAGKKRYKTALLELLDTHWNEDELNAELDRVEKLLEPHLGPMQRYQPKKLAEVRTFIKNRRPEIMEEIEDGLPDWRRRPDPPPAIPDRGGKEWATNIWDAARMGKFDVVKKQLAKGTDVDAPSPDGTTALAMAVLAGRNDMVKFLIDKGADVNTKNKQGHTPFHTAAFLGYHEVTKLMIDGKVNINILSGDKVTALDVAHSELNEETEGILEFIANFTQVRRSKEDIEAGRKKVIALLLENGAKQSTDLKK